MKRCQDCGIERQWLHRHHIIPKSQGGGDGDNLVKVCANCHMRRHGGPAGGHLRGLNSNTPEARAKKSATMKAHWDDPDRRAAKSKQMKETWKNPAHRAGVSESLKNSWNAPERRAAQSERTKELWSDPEKLDHMKESMRKVRAERFWSTKPNASSHDD